MDFLQGLLETLVDWARAVWPGVLGAAGFGYLGWSAMGLWGFVVGAAAGAIAGTLAGHRLGLLKVRSMTGTAGVDQGLYALSAFLVVAVGYFLVQFALLIGAVVAVAALALFWLSG
jgi:hypothetical protein